MNQLAQAEDTNKKLKKLTEEIDEEAKKLALRGNPYSKNNVIEEGSKQLKEIKSTNPKTRRSTLNSEDPFFKMMTLYELDNATLLTQGFSEGYRALAANVSKELQTEYKCSTYSEKATAHLAAQNFVRTLELQKEMAFILQADSYNDLRLRRYQLLSKAYDQANRQYLFSIQALQALKQPPINVNIKAQNANVANNQIIKQDTYEA